MTEIEHLIKQAKAYLKLWHKPENRAELSNKSWQEILDRGMRSSELSFKG